MQVELLGLQSLRVCACLQICVKHVFRGIWGHREVAGYRRLSTERWCCGGKVWGRCIFLLQFDVWGSCTPFCTCSLHLFCLCLAHNDANPLAAPSPPRRDKVQIISSFVMAQLDQCMNICMMMNCTAPCNNLVLQDRKVAQKEKNGVKK